MAMFQQTAYNLAKMGFYPTDDQTLECIESALCPMIEGQNTVLFDPCCGEGAAAARISKHLQQAQSIGVELDQGRAAKASEVMGRVIHSDINDCIIDKGVGFLFLNPPYGDTCSDRGRKTRLEDAFLRLSYPTLIDGGVLALIVPRYSVTPQFANYLVQRFDQLIVGCSPEQRFKQVIIMGRKIRPGLAGNVTARTKRVLNAVEGAQPWKTPKERFNVPVVEQPLLIKKKSIDADNLAQALKGAPTLWPDFPAFVSGGTHDMPQPLMPLSQWHTGLALSAGVVSGVVRNQKDVWLVKGSTIKKQIETVETEEQEDGRIITRTILTDQFVPVIKAIDLKPASDTYSHIFTIH